MVREIKVELKEILNDQGTLTILFYFSDDGDDAFDDDFDKI